MEEQAGRRKRQWHCNIQDPTMQRSTLRNEDMLHEGYQPKILLYALDKLFYIFDQVKLQQGIDERLVIAYEILCLSAL